MRNLGTPTNPQNKNFQLWGQDNHPIPLTTKKIAHQKLGYIHYNPVEAGFVESPEDFYILVQEIIMECRG